MDKEYLNGQMEESIKDNIKMIRKVDMEKSLGQMEKSIKDNGLMENKMEQAIIQKEEISVEKHYGKMEEKSNG